MEIVNFSDLVKVKSLDGDKKRLDEIEGKEIIITGFRISKSRYTDQYTAIQFYYADDETETKYVYFTGSTVITDQVAQISEKLEEGQYVKTVLKKIGKYHSLT